jgi:hypothetical protein
MPQGGITVTDGHAYMIKVPIFAHAQPLFAMRYWSTLHGYQGCIAKRAVSKCCQWITNSPQ